MLITLIGLDNRIWLSSFFSSHSEVCFWRGRVPEWRVKSNKPLSPSSCALTQNFRWSQEELSHYSDDLTAYGKPFLQISCDSPPAVKGKATRLKAVIVRLQLRQCLKLIINICHFWKKRNIQQTKTASLLQKLTSWQLWDLCKRIKNNIDRI